MNEVVTIGQEIEGKIFTIRGMQVMLDRDLAIFYQVETRALKQAVKRNMDKFPIDFMFELTDDEIDLMVSQNVIPSRQQLGGGIPMLFTEQGVSMLSSILKSKIATYISIEIIRTFVSMRKLVSSNDMLLQRMEIIEKRQIGYELKSDKKFKKLFNALEDKSIKPTQGVFFDGQIFDAYIFVNDLVKSAKHSIILIDNYVDETVLTLFGKNPNITFTVYTQSISKQLKLDIKRYNAQHKNLTVYLLKESHDRFLIIDKKELYHIGASLKDLGKKWFAFSVITGELDGILLRLEDNND